LSILLLSSCEYDYIHENSKHAQEYVGKWNVDYSLVKGVRVEQSIGSINIYQETVEFGKTEYLHWELKKNENPQKLILMNVVDVPEIMFDVIEPPTNKMVLKLNDTVYFFGKI
jgi:hypothetical protein